MSCIQSVKESQALPPTEEDVRTSRMMGRRELTRRGFLAGGIAAALGALSIPFWLRGGDEPPSHARLPELRKLLTGFRTAEADPELLTRLRLACLALYQDRDPQIRRLSADFMKLFPGDGECLTKLWVIVDADPVRTNQQTALRSLLSSARDQDVPRLVVLYRSEPWARAVMEEVVDAFGFVKLREALK